MSDWSIGVVVDTLVVHVKGPLTGRRHKPSISGPQASSLLLLVPSPDENGSAASGKSVPNQTCGSIPWEIKEQLKIRLKKLLLLDRARLPRPCFQSLC